MRLGIVGHEAAKFEPECRERTQLILNELIQSYQPSYIVSGRSPLGGVDVWAEEIALSLGINTLIFPPTRNSWHGDGGYRERNLQIAAASDLVVVVVVDELPTGFAGRRHALCYHCKRQNPPHIKSGGCWTASKAIDQRWIVVPQYPDAKVQP